MGKPPSNRRQRYAEQTRQEIVASARALFAAKGYRATTVRDVAAAANVSVQTVYDSVGSKPALVRALNDLIDREAGIAAFVETAATEEDPQALLAVPARVMRALVERCGDTLRILAAATADDEPDLARVVAEGQRRHRAGADLVAGRLDRLGALPPGSDPGQVSDTILALTDVRYALLLIDQHGWSVDRVEAWAIEALRRLVLHR